MAALRPDLDRSDEGSSIEKHETATPSVIARKRDEHSSIVSPASSRFNGAPALLSEPRGKATSGLGVRIRASLQAKIKFYRRDKAVKPFEIDMGSVGTPETGEGNGLKLLALAVSAKASRIKSCDRTM